MVRAALRGGARRLAGLLLGACVLVGGPAWAQVTLNQLRFPADVGRAPNATDASSPLDFDVAIDYQRQSAAAAVVRSTVPVQLTVLPPALPAACTLETGAARPVVACTLPAGAAGESGTLTFKLRGIQLGGFQLVATATGGSSIANSGTVMSAGELTLAMTRSPLGALLAGQTVSFTLAPQLAASADALPAGSVLTITNRLPGVASDFTLQTVTSGAASCGSVAAANASRSLVCTLAGPLSVAEINAVRIVLAGYAGSGAAGASGDYVNLASIAADQATYFDIDLNNNGAQLGFHVDPGSDLQAAGSFPSTPLLVGSAQTLTMGVLNNGPMAMPAGSVVSLRIPAGFTLLSLPAGCSGVAVGSVLAAEGTLRCTVAAVAVGAQRDVAVPLRLPASAGSGLLPVTIEPPAGYGDANAANNSIGLPWQAQPPYADLRLDKAKVPAGGPVSRGTLAQPTPISTTLTITNDAASTDTASWTAAGGNRQLRVIDYLRPEEVWEGVSPAVYNVSTGWSCTLERATDPTDAARTRRIQCVRQTAGSLAPGASISVGFSTRIDPTMTGQLTLSNRACTGEQMLTELGPQADLGPQPGGAGRSANDCATAGEGLVATDITGDMGRVVVNKAVSLDGSSWIDDPAAAPTLAAGADTAFWRIRITTPAAAPQATIPTLELSDYLPGVLALAASGQMPMQLTPATVVRTTNGAGVPVAGCPTSVQAGVPQLTCRFTQVAPGSTIEVVLTVRRPLGADTLLNTATVTSPDALLSGTLSDSAGLVVAPRVDAAVTSVAMLPAEPRVGQVVAITVTGQNLGPDAVTAVGAFKLIQDLNTDRSLNQAAFGDISASGANLACVVASSALADEPALAAGALRVRCTNTDVLVRGAVRTVAVAARVLKPVAAMPPSGNVFASAQVHAARVLLPASSCEFKTETVSNATVSTACNDSAALSNNRQTLAFNVLVPQLDLQLTNQLVLPAGRNALGQGEPVRYRLTMQNNGPSRAEAVTIRATLDLPTGFALVSPQVLNINAQPAASARFSLDTSKNASVVCSMPTASTLLCQLAAAADANVIDAGKEVNFEVEFTQTASPTSVPATDTSTAVVCSAESLAGYESSGGCDVNDAGNNLGRVNTTIFPRADLSLVKTVAEPADGIASINQPVRWQLVMRNNGPQATPQLRVTDTLPANFELLTDTARGGAEPALALSGNAGVGATLSCTRDPQSLTAAGQRQAIACVIEATGGAAFPSGSTFTLSLVTRAREGLFTGPYDSALVNSASVSVGLDANGNPLALDTNAANDSGSASVRIRRASLAGRVFNDRDGNGVQNGTDPALDEGIGAVALALAGTDSWGNPVSRSTASVNTVGATRGDFLFDDLPPGSYTLTETQPAAYVNSAGTPATPAAAGGRYTAAASATSSSWAQVALPAGTTASGYLFPESLPPAVIAGVVYLDRDRNGAQGASEPGIAGVSVSLWPAGTACAAPVGSALQTVQTNAAGAFAFAAVTSANGYVVCQTQPAGYGDAAPQPGASGSSNAANQISIASLPASGVGDLAFPEWLGAISGRVFADYASASPALADNGVQDAGEPGIGSASAGAGVPVTLSGVPSAGPQAGQTLSFSTTTAADGSFAFTDLFPGRWSLAEGAVPAALGRFIDGRNTAGSAGGTAGQPGTNSIGAITLGSGVLASGYTFAELPAIGQISGVVYLDANADGQRQTAEAGIAGQTIQLRGTDARGNPVSADTSTTSDGRFSFAELPPGRYTLSQPAQPGGTLNGAVTPGSNGGAGMAGSNPTATSSQISGIALALAASSPDHLFGEVPGAVISGRAFVDLNNNGLRETGDAAIAGQTIRLSGTESSGAAVSLATTTDSDGAYRFDNLAAGRYTVLQDSQYTGTVNGISSAGAVGGGVARNPSTTSSEVAGITLVAGMTSADNNFAEVPTGASIAGRVWLDRNNNGVIDGGEAFLAGVTLRLSGVDVAGNPVSRETSSDANGLYRFDGLAPGSYAVTEPGQPAGTLPGLTVRGSSGGSASAPTVSPSVISAIPLAVNQASTEHNFGEIPPASITGQVFGDGNGNGQRDGSDAGIPGQTVLLSGTDWLGNPVTLSTSTDAQGNYAFTNLAPGTYLISQPGQPAGTLNGVTTPGSTGGAASNPAGGGSQIGGVVLGTGVASTGNNFAEVTPSGSIAARVWLDANNNGAIDGSEAGIANVRIELSGTDRDGNPVATRTLSTDANGNVLFDGLLPGRYTLAEPQQPGGTLNGRTVAGSGGGSATALAATPSQVSAIVLAAGQAVSGNLFGEIPPASIAGQVFADANNDGRRQSGEAGYGSQTVNLSGTDDLGASVSLSTSTDANGAYAFTGLRPGSYTVSQPAQPAGSLNGITSAGSAGGTAANPSGSSSQVSAVVLGVGVAATGYDFAEVPPVSAITGRVWLDDNADGVPDAAEAGLAGVRLVLSGTDRDGRAVGPLETTTGADGSFSFANLLPGRYTVTEPEQPALPGAAGVATLNGRTVAGTGGGTATAVLATPSAIDGITLAAGQTASANLFGELRPASLSGQVFADNNDNGRVDSTEAGLAGVVITLSGTDDQGQTVNLSATSGSDGSFAFTGLRPGRYTLTEPVQPAGTVNGQTVAGVAGGSATAAGVSPSAISGIVLQPGTVASGNLFGEIGSSPDLRVSKQHTPARFTPGHAARYTITVRNAGDRASSGAYTVSDRLPAGVTLSATPAGSGWACTGAAGASAFSCSSSTVLAAGATGADTISVPVQVAASAAAGAAVNAVVVDGGGELDARRPTAAEQSAFNTNPAALPACDPAVLHNACADATTIQAAAAVSGTVWLDGGSASRLLDGGDTRLAGWTVELLDAGTRSLVASTRSGSDGSWRLADLEAGIAYAVQFREPGSRVVFGYPVNGETAPGSSGASCNANAAAQGQASSCVQPGGRPELGIVLAPGAELRQQSLPVIPGGTVYDSSTRQPVPGATVTLAPTGACPGFDPATQLAAAGYTLGGSSAAMTVGSQGWYQFVFLPTAPLNCAFGLTITPPPGYLPSSAAIPAAAGTITPVGSADTTYAVQPQVLPPSAPAGSGTVYYTSLTAGSSVSAIVNNHLPIDPSLPGGISLAKTGDRANAELGDTVRYTLTVVLQSGAVPAQTTIVDRLPAGFTFIPGTAMVNGQRIADPVGGVGPVLAFNLGAMSTGNTRLVLQYRVRLGVGSLQGDGTNRAQAFACQVPAGCVGADGRTPIASSVASNNAQHTVRVSGGVFGDQACFAGKVFVDCNHNHVQDAEELGIPGVRLVLQDGTNLVSDSEGKYSLCGLPPKGHVLKVDATTLPRGSRLTTSSNRNLGDAGSLWLDLKNGELHRADFVEGSCSNTVLEQVKARRAQGEVRAPETEKRGGPALRFDSKAHGKSTLTSPQQGTDGANQQTPKPRATTAPAVGAPREQNLPTPALPMNQPPPTGRATGDASDSNRSSANDNTTTGGRDATR